MSSNLQAEPPPAAPQQSVGTDLASILRRSEILPDTDYLAPGDPMQTRLAEMVRDILRLDTVGSTDNFFELGGDSLAAAELFVLIEREFGVVLSPSTIIYHPTVEALAKLLAARTQLDSDRIVVTLQSEGARPPLFLLHAIDGAVFAYRRLAQHLGPGRKIYALIFPGQDRHDTPTISMQAMATICVNAITTVQRTGPYFLAGYCLGGTLTYEVARQLRQQERQVALLVLIDAGTRDVSVVGANRFARKLLHHLEELWDKSPAEWFGYVWQKIRKELDRVVSRRSKSSATAVDSSQQEQQQVLLAAHSTYDPPPYDGELKLIRCVEGRYGPRHLGWAGHVAGAVEVCDLPAHHSQALNEPTVRLIAVQLNRWLDAVEASASHRASATT